MTKIRQNKKTTIYDLAELAGVSASAVSAILNGNWQKRRSSACGKVIRIAEEQNYAVNKQASLLRSNKSKIIGMLVRKYDNHILVRLSSILKKWRVKGDCFLLLLVRGVTQS